MKRTIPALLLACLLFFCSACGTPEPAPAPSSSTAAALTSAATASDASATGSTEAATTAATTTAPASTQTQPASAAATTAAHTTAPQPTALLTAAPRTAAQTTRRTYTTTPFTTRAKKPRPTAAASTVPASTAAPTAPAAPEPTRTHTCTVSITCSVVLQDGSKLKPEKSPFVPTGGQILAPVTVTFTPGEDAYTVLRRACAANSCVDHCAYCAQDGIQMEAAFTPGYNTYYVQGIHQIYEKDCGPKSGWLYRVNGVYPNVGSSSYTVRDGDRIEWIYALEPVVD